MKEETYERPGSSTIQWRSRKWLRGRSINKQSKGGDRKEIT